MKKQKKTMKPQRLPMKIEDDIILELSEDAKDLLSVVCSNNISFIVCDAVY